MSTSPKANFRKDSWQSPRNARTLRAYMALRNQEIGERLKELRAARGNPPQEAVAHAIGVSSRSYGAWEAGETKPSWRSLTRVAEYFAVSEHYILMGVEDPARPSAPDPFVSQGDSVDGLGRIEQELAEVKGLLEALQAAVLILTGEHLKQERERAERDEADRPGERPANES